jgi:HEAT repeats
MLLSRIILSLLILLFVVSARSAESEYKANPMMETGSNVQVLTSQHNISELRLIANNTSLQQSLSEITKATGATFHYSTLPSEPITANCQGALKPVLECLLGPNADMVFSQQPKKVSRHFKKKTPTQIAEVWLLNVPAVSGLPRPNIDTEVAEHAVSKSSESPALVNVSSAEPVDNTDALLAMAKQPEQRLDAINALVTQGRKDDMNVRAVLKEALTDQNPGVRAQAVFALAHREGEGAIAELQQAMQDENVDVRRMAVESAGNDNAILQLALKDQDASIRQYAITKLDLLNKSR